MIQYMSAEETAEKWKISHRRVSVLCSECRIPGAAMLGNMWIIPKDAKKPVDARMKRNSSSSKGMLHPFVKWAGGKSQLIDILISNFPKDIEKTINKYVEPFVGGGALFFAILNRLNFDKIYINDNNKELMNAYAVIKNNCDTLINKLNKFQSDYTKLDEKKRAEYYYLRREEFNKIILSDKTSADKAALFIFLNKTCFNGLYRVNKSGKFNVPTGKYKNPLICDEENLYEISKKLGNVEMLACDYHDLESIIDEKTFVYFDPPYRPLNATSAFTSYTEDQFNDKDQIELAEFYRLLAEKNAKLLLSNSDPHNVNYEDNFFDDLYKGFDIQRITATRLINSKAEKRGEVTELLIKNY